MADGGDGIGSFASNMDRIEQALLGLTITIQNNNSNGATGNLGGVATIKQFKDLKPPTFDGNNDPLVVES